MASNATEIPRPRRTPRPGRAVFPTGLSRYDLLLAVIPVAFALAMLAGYVLSVPIPVAMAAASMLGVVAIVEGVFRNPPIPGQ